MHPVVSPHPHIPWPSPHGANLTLYTHEGAPKSPPWASPTSSPPHPTHPASGTAGSLGIPIRLLHDQAGCNAQRGAASPLYAVLGVGVGVGGCVQRAPEPAAGRQAGDMGVIRGSCQQERAGGGLGSRKWSGIAWSERHGTSWRWGFVGFLM